MTRPACVAGAALRCLLVAVATLGALGAAAQPARGAEADFTWSPNAGVVNQRITFKAVQDPSITVYRWDLDGNGQYGDREDASGPQVPRTFKKARSYTVGLATVDGQGNVNERVKTVRVVAAGGPAPLGNRPPDASFVFFPAGPVAGEPITLVSTSTDPDSPIPAAGQQWDLNGDGVFRDAAGPSATTSFPVAGTYTISLRITTNATDVATVVLSVGNPSPPGASVGQRTLSLLSPFPVVRIAGRVSGRGARIRRLTISAPPGTRVKVRCGGRGCPFRRVLARISSRVSARGLPPTRLLHIRRLEGRLLRPGARLRLFVTRTGAVGKYTRFDIRRRKPPSRTDMCLVPGSGRPLVCPSR